MTPSRDRILFGTDEPVAAPVLLAAGPLTVELEDGNLRYVRLNGHEMLRAVSYLVRDRNWGTYRPQIENLAIESDAEGFRVSYEARVADTRQALAYRARIEGRSDGSLSFAVDATPEADFSTNRAGFVVLHPIEGVSGQPATVEDADGGVSETRFPDLIDPIQPMLNLRAITHAFAPGHRVTCRMEGDVFEMEDQRNWLDASYKTYVRPLSRPWPYTLAKGVAFSQAVSLAVSSAAGAHLEPPPARASLTLPAANAAPGSRVIPLLGIGLEARDAAATREAADLLRQARPRHVVCLHVPPEPGTRDTLDELLGAAATIGGETCLEAVIGSLDGFAGEVRRLGAEVEASGHHVSTVMISPAADLKSTTPGQTWPPAPPADELYREARRAFPRSRLGGGMFSYFTELNRKRPPLQELDFVTFTTCSIVHACDDRSVTEGLEALPAILRSARAIAGEVPLHVGPSAIGMRMNPYGAAPVDNPSRVRVAMARQDPRQDGLLGAAWALGYLAHLAHAGVRAATLGGGVGDFGLLSEGAVSAKRLRPVFHVFRGLAALAGAPLVAVVADPPRALQGLAARTKDGLELWLANLTGDDLPVRLPALTAARLALLDESSFATASADPTFMDKLAPSTGQTLELPPYAVARLVSR